MDRPRDQLFAGTALAVDVHGGRRLGDLADRLVDPAHRIRPANDLAEMMLHLFAQVLGLRLERVALTLEGPRFERLLDFDLELVGIEGLGDEVDGSQLHRLDGDIDRPVRGDQHDFGISGNALLADRLQELEPVHPLHLEVRDDEIEALFGAAAEGRVAVGHREHLMPCAAQDLLDTVPHGRVVLDHENARLRAPVLHAPVPAATVSAGR